MTRQIPNWFLTFAILALSTGCGSESDSPDEIETSPPNPNVSEPPESVEDKSLVRVQPTIESSGRNGDDVAPTIPAEAWETPAGLALLMANRTSNTPSERISLLCFVAVIQAKAGDKDQAVDTIAQATETMTEINDEKQKVVATHGMVVTLAKIGNSEQALEQARTMNDARLRALTLIGIATARTEDGDSEEAVIILKQALDEIRLIAGASQISHALRLTAVALAEAGNGALASELAGGEQAAGMKAALLVDIATALAEAGKTVQASAARKQAFQAAQQIKNTRLSGSPLEAIAAALAEAGDNEQAMELSRKFEFAEARVPALVSIARAQIKAGDKALSLNTLRQASEEVGKIENIGHQLQILMNIASAQGEAGNNQQAVETLTRALGEAQKTKKSHLRTMALSSVATALAKAGEKEQALATLKQAQSAAEQIQLPSFFPLTKEKILGTVAQAFAASGDVKHAIELAKNIESLDEREISLVRIASGLAKDGDVSHALKVVQMCENPPRKLRAFQDMVETCVKAGQMTHAVDVALEIEDAKVRASQLSTIVMRFLAESKRHNMHYGPPRRRVTRVKTSFTPQDLQLAKRLAMAMQTTSP